MPRSYPPPYGPIAPKVPDDRRSLRASHHIGLESPLPVDGLQLRLESAYRESCNGFGMFWNFLRYKPEERGKHFITVDKWFPSPKKCRHCGEVNFDVQLGQSVWDCPHCGTIIDRDLNAAINIRNEGLRTFYIDRATA